MPSMPRFLLEATDQTVLVYDLRSMHHNGPEIRYTHGLVVPLRVRELIDVKVVVMDPRMVRAKCMQGAGKQDPPPDTFFSLISFFTTKAKHTQTTKTAANKSVHYQ